MISDDKSSMTDAYEELTRHFPDNIKAAAKHTVNNREEIIDSKICGCYYCLNIFDPSEIVEWISSNGDVFPMCPHCQIDSVYGDASGFPVNKYFLTEMNNYWFDGDGIEVNNAIK